MGFNCGIVGLPNVGKSTLFNALTSSVAAEAANYPFCTIEPNVGRVGVPDKRLDTLAAIAQSKAIIPTFLEFVDIAGLVRGASKGEGLGNQFLGHIREVDAIVHVLRCFEDENITHVENSVDPLRDAETVETELMLADLESLERQHATLVKKRSQDKEAKEILEIIERALPVLREGKPARCVKVDESEQKLFKRLNLITAKPVLYACNVDEDSVVSGNAFSKKVQEKAAAEHARCVLVSAAVEAELVGFDDTAERQDFLASLGLEESGLSQIIREGYGLLDLITYFTIGPKEARAWTISRHTLAPQAAGVIHSDFERGFIAAETVAYEDYVAYKGESGAKAAGKMRIEGKSYVVQDGDVVHFRFNV